MKKVALQNTILTLMTELEKEYGWKFTDEEYKNTPIRIKNMFDEFKRKNEYTKFTEFNNTSNYDALIVMNGINTYSFCSHHLLPFFGTASVVYLPNKKILGASKLVRIVQKFSYKGNSQEALTVEIADELNKILEPRALMIFIEARHLCMLMRGVEESGSVMTTSAIRGDFFENISLKEEALRLIGR